MNSNLYQLTLRHTKKGNNTMNPNKYSDPDFLDEKPMNNKSFRSIMDKAREYQVSELGKIVGNECLDCPFNMSFKTEIVDYCLNECYGGRRDMVNDDAR